ncbi:hypothetical protein C1A40_03380 [Tamlana carrageenivorans]|uniref:Uncharacterized protein n=1 Tax=Pseudotamlana carrageenivorans TaxID=2069432 RepID=A0A2I7SFD4_9FLAO|nr:hypothetical protein C1A40_03380 [Tamlana carrageenivorans]
MFKQRKHKTFNYQPRFSKENQGDLSDSKDADATPDFVSKWRKSSGSKPKMRGPMSTKILVLILVLLLICMYILDKKYL